MSIVPTNFGRFQVIENLMSRNGVEYEIGNFCFAPDLFAVFRPGARKGKEFCSIKDCREYIRSL